MWCELKYTPLTLLTDPEQSSACWVKKEAEREVRMVEEMEGRRSRVSASRELRGVWPARRGEGRGWGGCIKESEERSSVRSDSGSPSSSLQEEHSRESTMKVGLWNSTLLSYSLSRCTYVSPSNTEKFLLSHLSSELEGFH